MLLLEIIQLCPGGGQTLGKSSLKRSFDEEFGLKVEKALAPETLSRPEGKKDIFS